MTAPIPSFLDVGLGTAVLALGAIPAARWVSRGSRDAAGYGLAATFLALSPVMSRAALVHTALWLAAALFLAATLASRTRHARRAGIGLALLLAACAASLGFGSAFGSGIAASALAVFLVAACAGALRGLDAVEGLAAGIAAIAAAVLAIAFHSLQVNAWRDLCAAMCGAMLAFLMLHGKMGPRVALGDGAVLACGFLLGLAALRLVQVSPAGRAAFAPWLILGVPLVELGIAVCRRFLAPRASGGRTPPCRRLQEVGLGRSRVLGLFWAAGVVVGILGLRVLEV